MSSGLYRLLALVVLAIALTACASQRSAPGKLASSSPAPRSSLRTPVRRVEIAPVGGHSQPISEIAVSSSKRLLVTGSTDHTMSVWNLATGALLRTINSAKGCEGGLLRVTDEETALVRCLDGTLRQWDLRSGAETRVEKAHRGAFTAVLDRAGRRALTASIGMDERDVDGRQRVLLWDLDRLERVRVAAEIPGHVAQLAWSDDGRHALVTTYRLEDGTALIDIDTGKTLRRFEPKSENAVDRLGFDATGRRVIIGHAGGPTLVVDVGTGRIEQRSERALPPFVVGPEGQLLSIDRGLVQRDIQRLEAPIEIGWRGTVTASAWTADRAQVAAAGGDAVRLIDTGSGSVLQRLDHESIGDWQAAIAPDGLTVALKRCRLASSADTTRRMSVGSRIDIVSLETGAVVKTLRSAIDEECGLKITFSGLGSRLIEEVAIHDADGGLRIWDVASGKKASARVGVSWYRLSPFPDDRTGLLAMDGLVSRIDFDRLTELAQYRTPRHPICSAVSPDGDLVMVESFEDVRVWDARSSKLISTFPPVRSEEEAKSVAATAAFSPDGKVLAIAETRSVRLHDPRSGTLVRRWPVAKQLTMLRFIDGGTLASADSEGVVTIWDIRNGLPLASDTRAQGQILDLRGVDGVLISASRDTAVRLIPVPVSGH